MPPRGRSRGRGRGRPPRPPVIDEGNHDVESHAPDIPHVVPPAPAPVQPFNLGTA